MIALRAPTAIDLRVILSVMRISANLERIGDLAKNLAKRNAVLMSMPAISGSASQLRRMSRDVQIMLKDALDAYIQRDDKLAMSVIERDVDIDQMYNTLFREFLTFMLEDPRNITPCMHLHFIAKNVERMGDHVTRSPNRWCFGRRVIKPDEPRQKEDNTSTDANLSQSNDSKV